MERIEKEKLVELLLIAINHINIIPHLANDLGRSDFSFNKDVLIFLENVSSLNPKNKPFEDIYYDLTGKYYGN